MLNLFKRKGTKYNYEMRHKMKGYTKLNLEAKKNQVVMIGDSIIDLYPTNVTFVNKNDKVYNRGISGDTSDQMLNRLYDNALSISPKTLFVLIGTNDISRGLTHDDTVSNIESILTLAKSNNVENVYLESVYPVNKDMDKNMVGIRTNELILSLNARLKELCAKLDVTYLDIYPHLLDEDGQFKRELSLDGLHPNIKGYEVITKLITDLID